MIFTDKNGEAAGALMSAPAGSDAVNRLERMLTDISGKRATAIGTVDGAIHTALHICGVNAGDYVFVPTFTFYSYITTVSSMGAIPVFLDCDTATRCVSASALETALLWSELQHKLPKAVIVDNAFGAVADCDSIVPICKAKNIPVIELACSALGGTYKGKMCGSNGDIGIVGFDRRMYGRGGVLLCDVDALHAARAFARIDYSDGESHDYRMDGITAALNLSRLDMLQGMLARSKKTLAALAVALDNIVVRPTEGDAARYALVKAIDRMSELRASGYEVKRPPLAHTLEKYRDCHYFEHEPSYSACRAYDDYIFIDTDISLLARKKLVRMLRRS